MDSSARDDLKAEAGAGVRGRRVFGEPFERDGVTVLPVARVVGGGGGGKGGGSGFRATPAGVYTIKDGRVAWHPALDLNRVILGGQLMAIVIALVVRSIMRGRARD